MAAAATGLPQVIGKPGAKGAAVFNLFIKKVAPDASGNIVLTAAAMNGAEPVGLELVIGKNWRHPPKPNEHKLVGQVEIRALGPPTEALVRAMAHEFRMTMPPYAFTTAEFEAMSDGTSPATMRTEPLDLELTHGFLTEWGFATLYCHIDLASRWVQLQEEYPDQREWRKNLLALLTAPEAERALFFSLSGSGLEPIKDSPLEDKVDLMLAVRTLSADDTGRVAPLVVDDDSRHLSEKPADNRATNVTFEATVERNGVAVPIPVAVKSMMEGHSTTAQFVAIHLEFGRAPGQKDPSAKQKERPNRRGVYTVRAFYRPVDKDKWQGELSTKPLKIILDYNLD